MLDPRPAIRNRNMFDLLDHYATRREAILKSIRELVERETKSREESRLNEIAGFVAGQLREIGGHVELVPQTGYGTHLRARFDFGHGGTERGVLVVGHLDTVWPVGALERLPFRVTPEGRAHGPGIFDMKSGVAIVVESLRTIVSRRLATKRPVTLLLTGILRLASLSWAASRKRKWPPRSFWRASRAFASRCSSRNTRCAAQKIAND